ncbi:HAD-IA family hydrolase [Roseiconus nitratireducens]|nr:HAD-IA family hydrolase [Roseiconus nitratireducens]
MRPYDWIVFDSTGTLMTPDPEPAVAYQAAGRRLGLDVPLEAVRRNLKSAMGKHFLGACADLPTDAAYERQRWKQIVRDALLGLPEHRLEDVFDQLWEYFAVPDHWQVFADVAPTLQRLRRQGYRLAVASNFDARLRRILEGMQLTDQVDEILISSDLGWSKPNPRFYGAATERLAAADRSRVLMIGDTHHGDVVVARESGWHARHLVRDQADALSTLTADL